MNKNLPGIETKDFAESQNNLGSGDIGGSSSPTFAQSRYS